MFYYQKKGIPSENPFLFRKELLVNSLGPDQVQNFVAPDLDILIELVLII